MPAITLQEIADLVGADLRNCKNPDYPIQVLHPLDSSDYISNSIAFIKDSKYLEVLKSGCVDAVLVNEKMASKISDPDFAILVVDDPYVAFAKVAQKLDTTIQPTPGIHPTAVIHPSVVLGATPSIGPYAVIEEGAVLGDNCIIGAQCYVGHNCKLGNGVRIYPQVVLYQGVILGDQVQVHSGTVLGADGFGYANEKGRWIKIPQVGTTVIGDRTEIGALTTIDRGALRDTVVEEDVIIDNHIHLGHNCKVGRGTAMAGGTIVAGSTTFGKYCIIGGASVFNGHIHIADFVTVTGMAMVPHSLTESHKTYSSGIPVEENSKWLRSTVMLRYDRLKDQNSRIRQLEKEVVELKQTQK